VVYRLWTISTFSCNIARSISREPGALLRSKALTVKDHRVIRAD
jgi:hypothetical protein